VVDNIQRFQFGAEDNTITQAEAIAMVEKAGLDHRTVITAEKAGDHYLLVTMLVPAVRGADSV
jgi:hypothetical protein